MDWIIRRLAEKSTWAGLLTIGLICLDSTIPGIQDVQAHLLAAIGCVEVFRGEG